MIRVNLECKRYKANFISEPAETIGDDKGNYVEIVNKKCDIQLLNCQAKCVLN